MKNILQKISKIGIVAIVGLIALGTRVSVASAGYSMNTASNDCATYMVVNATTNPQAANTACWPSGNITVNDGDTINLAVYFHNNGDAPADNVSVRITDFRGTKSGTFNTAGQLYVGGTAVKSGTQTITVPNNSVITLVGVYIQTQSNRDWQTLSTASNIFSATGANIGTVNPGWPNQGVVKAVYKVTATQTATYQCNDGIDNDSDGKNNYPNDPGCDSLTDNSESPDPVIITGQKPTVTTNSVSSLNASEGSVVLQGSYSNSTGNTNACFQYGLTNGSSSTVNLSSNSDTAANFSKSILNLPTGIYQYRACAENNYGMGYGEWRTFTISRNDINPQTSNATVDTLNYRNLDIQNGSVTMVGRYYGVDGGVASVYFNYRRSGTSTLQTSSTQYYDSSREFSHSLSSLSSGNYDYQACIYYRGSEKCGSWESFSINRYVVPVTENTRPNVTTLSPLQISSDFVTMDGYYDMNGCAGTTYFEYGQTDSFGNRTNGVSRGQSGSMAQSINGLTPGTTYYYRAVADNCAGTTYGAVRSFTTSNKTTVIRDNTPIIIGGGTTTVRNNTNTVRTNTTTATTAAVVGTGARYVRLTIDNGRDTVAKGDELVYTVQWENISNVDLKDLVLEVSIPEALEIVSTEQGQIDKKANTIYINISELRAGERDEMDVRAKVNGSLEANESITARAIIAFENPELRSQENAIAYDSDSYITSKNVLGASIFGLDFLPGTLAGWLFIILLIVLLILLIRYATGRVEQRNHYYHYDDDRGMPQQPQAPVAPVASAPHNLPQDDYAPYRPMRKD
jgi:hypothetical protein